ncbi:MAG TPA: hypothetical protein VGM81_04680 [Burkholderiaceae bacterium]|jgi:hypothetical protein
MQDKPPFSDTEPDSQFGSSSYSAESIFLPDSGWGLLNHLHDIEAREIRRARTELHQRRALDHVLIEDTWPDEDAELFPSPRGDLH